MNDDRITDLAPWGMHVPLRCRNHPELRWSTKNIAPLGCRNIFYNTYNQRECDCSMQLLEVVEDELK